MDVQLRQQPVANKGSYNSNGDIGNETKTSAAHDLTRKPARDQSNKQNDE